MVSRAQTLVLTAQELASRWQMSAQTLANMRSAQSGPTYMKIGTAVRYRITDIEAYETAHLVAA